MTLFARRVDLDSERARLTELLQRNLPDYDHARRFEWLYRQNPAGEARAWFVCDGTDDRVVGAASLFPKFVWVDQRVEICAQVGDFAIDVSHRSLGPALMLQRATFVPVDEGAFAFCYDCPPHERGMATFHRLRLEPVCQMGWFSKLLKADAALRKRIPGGSVIQMPVATLANAVLRALEHTSVAAKDLSLSKYDAPINEEFSVLDERLSHRGAGIRARRFAEDLDWKFRQDPLRRFTCVTARRDDALVGFVVYRRRKLRANIVDVTGDSEAVRLALLHAATAAARAGGAESIGVLMPHESAEASLVKSARFRHRAEAERVVVYASEGVRRRLSEASLWKWVGADIMA